MDVDESLKQMNRETELLKKLSETTVDFTKENGRLNEHDLKAIVKHFARFIPDGELFILLERIKLKRLGL